MLSACQILTAAALTILHEPCRGIIMMKVALHRLTRNLEETSEVINQTSMAGAAR